MSVSSWIGPFSSLQDAREASPYTMVKHCSTMLSATQFCMSTQWGKDWEQPWTLDDYEELEGYYMNMRNLCRERGKEAKMATVQEEDFTLWQAMEHANTSWQEFKQELQVGCFGLWQVEWCGGCIQAHWPLHPWLSCACLLACRRTTYSSPRCW